MSTYFYLNNDQWVGITADVQMESNTSLDVKFSPGITQPDGLGSYWKSNCT